MTHPIDITSGPPRGGCKEESSHQLLASCIYQAS